ncbi:hypothetical protein MD484_g8048, partial [Candolleomyces efflorescens]
MPPLVDKPDSSSNYTFLLESSSSLADLDSSQVTPSTITIAFPSNISTTESPVTASFSLPPSPVEQPMASTSSGRPRSKSTRGQQPKKRVSNHIPRPPNAFILFRSSFIKSQQIPDTVEGNHSNLSKIIGHYWKALSAEERAEWEAKAVAAQEEHRQLYPDWRFRPGPYSTGAKAKTKEGGTSSRRRSTVVKTSEPSDGGEANDEVEVSKSRNKGKEKESNRLADDDRCAKIAGLIREGKKGDELAIAVEEWEDKNRRTVPGSQTKTSVKAKPDRLTPQSPGSPPLVSSPDRHSTASTSGEERSRDLSQSPPITSQSPSSAIGADPLKLNFAAQDLKQGRGSGKPPPKGISNVPLTQMFARSHPETSTSTSIADLCPTNRFDIPQAPNASSTGREYAKAPLRSSSMGYTLPQPTDDWQAHQSLAPYGSQSSQGSFWHWQSGQSDLSQPSSDKQCSDDIPREMGYETDRTVMAYESYGKNFDSSDLPSDGSEAASWNTSASRHGLTTIINDPLDDSPPLSSNTFPSMGANTTSTPHSSDPNNLESSFYYQPLPPIAPSPLNFPPTSFSTLTGWAGDYSFNPGIDGSRHDKSGRLDSTASPRPSNAGGWYPQEGHWPSSSRQHGHSMGMVLSADDWDNVEDLDPRTNR